MSGRALTQAERVAIVNAVQTLVGRIDRVVGADALFAAYGLVAERVRAEFAARYVPEASPAPVQPRAPTYQMLPRRVEPEPAEFDPFA